ncbi:uncharacterized protein LOC114524274 isoform X2 [Dendronephthya gigantea]|uniref:uncharacterized protein LOC114524274 isoform X2 n=1 Tax=Dendronephthya gigantea TaxID=151771 RepID=UPI00106AF4FB|nr:uncharacterized protein LOC114524274 isoform X2 [Dendronephthya gigantea]
MSAVFTIREADFDDLDDEEFLNEALNFESEQLTKGVPCQNISDYNGPGKMNECHSKQNILRSKGSSVNSFPNSGKSSSSLRSSSSIFYTSSNQPGCSKRTPGDFDDQLSAEPPMKRLNCVEEKQSCTLGKDQSLLSLTAAITTRKASEYMTGVSAEPKVSVNVKDSRNFNFNPVISFSTTSNISDGLRYVQNTTSAVSSPRLTDGRPENLIGAQSAQTSNIRSKYNDKDSSRGVLRETLSQTSVSKQTLECNRFSKDCLRRSCLSEILSDTHTNSTLPVTPTTHFTLKNSSRGTKTPSVDIHTPKRKGFARESPVLTYLRTFTDEKRCSTPRRFPGPAGILPPKMDPDQTLDSIRSLSSTESPTKITPRLFELGSCDEVDDFAIKPWTLMQEKVAKDFPDACDTLASVAGSQELHRGKVAFLAVLVKSFNPNGLDFSIVLKDPSGEMHGVVHKKVIEKVELGPGCGFILKQVSVFSPSPRKHYLNITPRNIVEVFPAVADPSSKESGSDVTTLRESKQCDTQPMCLDSGKEIHQAETVEESNFDELLEGLDDDDDMLQEAMNL